MARILSSETLPDGRRVTTVDTEPMVRAQVVLTREATDEADVHAALDLATARVAALRRIRDVPTV